jgi:hypothetical protein
MSDPPSPQSIATRDEQSVRNMVVARYRCLTQFAIHARELFWCEEALARLVLETKGQSPEIPDAVGRIEQFRAERKGHIACMRNMDPPVTYVEIARIIGLSVPRAREIGRKLEARDG